MINHTLQQLRRIIWHERNKEACVFAHFEHHPQAWSDILQVALECPAYFANSARTSHVQGSIITAILDDVTWMALQCALLEEHGLSIPTVSIEIKTTYLQPTPVGKLLATGNHAARWPNCRCGRRALPSNRPSLPKTTGHHVLHRACTPPFQGVNPHPYVYFSSYQAVHICICT